MEIKVVREFISNETGHHYLENEVWPFEPEKDKELIEGRKEALMNLGLLQKEESLEEKTKDELKEKLDEKKVAYDPKANKPELIALLEKALKDTE